MKKLNLFQLSSDFSYYHPELEGVVFSNEWCHIEDGFITVCRGYSWDGCSPKFDLLGLAVIGVPDGRLCNGLPITYYASLVHDVFCQWRAEIAITKAQTVKIFDDMLQDVGFSSRPAYVWAVDHLGPQRFAGDVA